MQKQEKGLKLITKIKWSVIDMFTGVFIGYAIGSYLEMQKREEPRITKLKELRGKK